MKIFLVTLTLLLLLMLIGLPATAEASDCMGNPTPPVKLVTLPGDNTGEIKLSWTAGWNADNYSVYYGINHTDVLYGAARIGNRTSFVVSHLDPKWKYFFRVKAHCNDLTSDYSNLKGGFPRLRPR